MLFTRSKLNKYATWTAPIEACRKLGPVAFYVAVLCAVLVKYRKFPVLIPNKRILILSKPNLAHLITSRSL
jgi:hypothetical protein